MYEDLVWKKEEPTLKVTKNEDIKYNVMIGDCYINNHRGTVVQDHINKTISINKAVILPRTYEFYNPVEEEDLVAVPRKLMELMERLSDDREDLENELIYYKHICENLQKQLTGIEMEKLNRSLPGQRIVVDNFNQISLKAGNLVIDMQKNEIRRDPKLLYWDQWASLWNDSVPKELEIKFPLQELQLFDGDINWLMVMCEDWEPNFKYTSWCNTEWETDRDLQQVNFKSMYETEMIPDDKSQARFFGEPIKDFYPEEIWDDDYYSRKGHELCFQ